MDSVPTYSEVCENILPCGKRLCINVLLVWFMLIKNVDMDHHLRQFLTRIPWYPWRRTMNSHVKNIVEKREIVVDIDAVKEASLLQIEGVQ